MRSRSHKGPRLPDVLRLVYKHGGADCLVALSKTIGGKRFSIPKHPSDSHPLVQGCGRKVADAVAREHGGVVMEFPTGRNVVNLLLARTILEGGGTTNDLVESLHVHFSTAKRIRNRLKKTGIPQLDVAPVKLRRKIDPRQTDIEDLLAS